MDDHTELEPVPPNVKPIVKGIPPSVWENMPEKPQQMLTKWKSEKHGDKKLPGDIVDFPGQEHND
jgi:hypothetical protein